MTHYLLDTNVLYATTANDSVDCQRICIDLLSKIFNGQIILVIDHENYVLSEYRRNFFPDPNPSAPLASQFLMHVITHRTDIKRIKTVSIPQNEQEEFIHFPTDERLTNFDRSDRKWVAIQEAFRQIEQLIAPIVNATDSDWLIHADVLAELGIVVKNICTPPFSYL